ncbi:hypothetical protein SlsnVgp070 [Spodoptera littoralis nucleopolyhedrovirus]|uniref:Uncharacterized protein n=1 Tax=Spodoptera littoralis nuclear polyhedrosis virus TaxID=10456 RepID=M1JTG4_NPVSL|nr:hypothetical protein SlsnVgp070 [Spodoptera littoralis nucleopolyhedrovirus]AGE89925.1 hypothetical protein SlsnVgp070 [Spodoptera littoralis nucleopolyhedrovirus]
MNLDVPYDRLGITNEKVEYIPLKLAINVNSDSGGGGGSGGINNNVDSVTQDIKSATTNLDAPALSAIKNTNMLSIMTGVIVVLCVLIVVFALLYFFLLREGRRRRPTSTRTPARPDSLYI